MIPKIQRFVASHQKPVAITSVSIIATAVILVIVALLVTGGQQKLPHVAKQSAADKAAIEHEIHSYAEPIKTAESYSKLPEPKREEFLKKEATNLGLNPTEEVTPEQVTNQCIFINQRKLIQSSQRIQGDIHEYQTALNHALNEIRDTCYANYDPEGKVLPDEEPVMHQH